MKVSGESESLAAVNRVPIHRALVFADETHPADRAGTLPDDSRQVQSREAGCPRAAPTGPSLRPGRALIPGRPRPVRPGSSRNVNRRTRSPHWPRCGWSAACFRDRIDDPAAALALLAGGHQGSPPGILEGRMRDRGGRRRAQRAAPGRAGQGTARFRAGSPGAGGRADPHEPPQPGLGRLVFPQGRQAVGPGRLRPCHGRAGLAEVGRRAGRLARCAEPIDRGVPPQQGVRPRLVRAPQVAGGISRSTRSRATSRSSRHATGPRGPGGPRRSHWPETSSPSIPIPPMPTASPTWPPSARRDRAVPTGPAPAINRSSPIIPAARSWARPGRRSPCWPRSRRVRETSRSKYRVLIERSTIDESARRRVTESRG